MGRRKLTRILLEANSNKLIKNKQNETPKDIAVRKELNEIIVILNVPSAKPRKEGKAKDKTRDKSIERTIDITDGMVADISKKSKEKDINASPTKNKEKRKSKNVHFESNAKHWSPYGCHYYPDPKNFPKPNLDSLPKEPLKKGEQYFLDLAGNICKGPVGVGYTCYCAPFFRHMEDKLNRDKQEIKHHIDKAHEKLDQKVTNLELKTQGQISELTRCVAAERVLCRERQHHLEQWLTRGIMFRASERVKKIGLSPKGSVDLPPLKRTQSLEMLDATSKTWNIIRSFNDHAFDTKTQIDDFRKCLRNTSKSADVLDGNTTPDSKKNSALKKENRKSRETLISSDHRSDNDQRSDNNRASIKSSEKSITVSNYNSDQSKFSRNGSGSSYNVTAEVHAKSLKSILSRSPMRHEISHQSESDDKYSSSNKKSPRSILTNNNMSYMLSGATNTQIAEQNKYPRNNYQKVSEIVKEKSKTDGEAQFMESQREANVKCFEEIENDGYIRIPKHSVRSDDNILHDPIAHSCSNDIQDSSRSSLHLDNVSREFQTENTNGIIVENGPRKSVHELVAKIQEQQIIDEIQRISKSPVRELKSPVRNMDGSISRPLTPTYLVGPTKSPVHNSWQNNSIPLSDNTHFNTIEPISPPIIIQPSPSILSKTEPNVKSPKKFSFHNLIPFPSRKMFNFQQKTDGNKSESSDEEDEPIKSTLEPGLMNNSNLLTTLPLPNYENMVSSQSAQPQIPIKTVLNGHYMNNGNHMALRGSLLPIPKDAYFHEIPNRQRMHDNHQNPRGPIQYQTSNHIHPQPHLHYNNSTSLAQPCFNSVGQPGHPESFAPPNYGRSRNPVYNSNNLLTEMMHDHINRELSRTPHSYANHAGHNSQMEMPNTDANIHQGYLRQFPAEPAISRTEGSHYPPREMMGSHGNMPMGSQMLPPHGHHDAGIHLQNHMHNLAINTHLSEMQSQLDRDSHNDSGYSTKVYGSSQGASPSLSGNIDCSENLSIQKSGVAMNRNLRTNLVNPPHSHLGASSLV